MNRLDSLDGLRALAIAAVVLVHCGQLFTDLPSMLRFFTSFSASGVQLFFVVSGYTLFANYGSRQFDPVRFFFRRVFRLAPMFYVGTALYVLLEIAFKHDFGLGKTSPSSVGLTILFIHGWLPETINAVVPGGWSIAAEATFYATFPLIYYLSRWRSAFWLFSAASVIVSAGTLVSLKRLVPDDAEYNFSYYFWLTQYPAFLLGCGLPSLAGWLSRRARLARALTFGAAASLLVLSQQDFSGRFLVVDLVLGMLVLGVVSAPPRWLTAPPLANLGRVSYSLYVLHFALVWIVGFAAKDIVGALGPIGALALAFAVVGGCGWALSNLTYIGVEQPMIRLGRRLLEPSVAPPSQSTFR